MAKKSAPKVPPKPVPSYDRLALSVLIYEFFPVDRTESDELISKRLRRKKLGDFDPERIARLRRLKDELHAEIRKQEKSRYYDGPKSKKARMQTFVEMEDFDIPKLTLDMVKRHPKISKRDVRWFVPFSVFVNHLL